MKRIFFFIVGLVALGVGLIGVVLPVLPTTPFIILATFCFAQSSEKIEKRLKASKLYQNYAADFVEDRSMTKQQKIRITILADTMMILSIVIVSLWWVRVIIFLALLTQLYIFIFKIPTKK